MEDKEKQITEMAKTMCFQANSCIVKSCVQVNCEKTWLAENLYNAGYRKIPENSVVLSADEFANLKKYAYEKGSKETAEKYKIAMMLSIQEMQKYLEIDDEQAKLLYYHNAEIAKQFSGEIKD